MENFLGKLACCLLSYCCLATAQNSGNQFTRYTVRDGLSHSVVQALIQDHRGFLWVGTRGGLNRYDGKGFVFTNLARNSDTIDKSISSLAEDRKHRLWVGTWEDGLEMLNLDTGMLSSWRHDSDDPNSLSINRIQCVFVDSQDVVWIGTVGGGLNRYREESNTFQRWPFLGSPETGEKKRVWSFHQSEPNSLWLATNEGLILFEIEQQRFTQFVHEPGNAQSLSSNTVLDVTGSSKGVLWVATADGLNRFDVAKKTFMRFKHHPADPTSLPTKDVYHLLLEDKNNIWLGTTSGVVHYNIGTGIFKQYNHDSKDSTTLSNPNVNALCLDQSKVMWVGTAGGVNKTDRKPRKFQHISQQDQENSLNHNKIGALLPARNGMLWIGTFGGGLNSYDPTTGRFREHPTQPKGVRNQVRTLFEDDQDRLWVGSSQLGLLNFDRVTEHYTIYANDPNRQDSLSSNKVISLNQDRLGRLWVGTEMGLNVYVDDSSFINSANNSNLKKYLSNQSINVILPDKTGAMWLGTPSGLVHMHQNLTEAKLMLLGDKTRSDNEINALYEDEQGFLWIGTIKGLNRLHVDTGEFLRLTTKDGLPFNYIMAILADKQGRLWISSRKGLCRYDTSENQFRSFDIDDGLQDLSFVERAAALAASGEMYFGGDNGYNLFNPSQLKDNPYKPPVVLTGFKKLDSLVQFEMPTPLVQNIRIKESEKIISFEFAALDFTLPRRNNYAYKLDGFNTDWIQSRDPVANYTNLDAGKYLFRIKATNNDGIWSKEGPGVSLTVVPPFYKTPLAFVFYILFGILAAVTIPMLRIRALNHRKAELELEVSHRTREILRKNSELGEKNKELVTLEEIVRVINAEVKLEKLASALIRQAQKMFANIDTGMFMIYRPKEKSFQIMASMGYDDQPLQELRFTREAMNEHYDSARHVDEGVMYLKESLSLPPNPELQAMKKASAMLVMTVPLEAEVNGLLILESHGEKTIMHSQDIEKLKRFRQHAISAVAKASLVLELTETARDLEKTQQLLIESAHRAGMAEIAGNVAHTLGNTLNSISTSTELIMDLGHSPAISLFHKITGLLENNLSHINDFLTEDNVGKKVPNALVETSKSLIGVHHDLESEVANLSDHITYLKRMMSAQQEYAQGSSLSQDVDLLDCLDDVLMFQKLQLEGESVKVVRQFVTLPAIKVSRPMLIRVLMNLLTNAVEALAKISEPVINLRVFREGDYVNLVIEDNGKGIERENLTRIFNQGFSSKHQGSGFGLHYCANVLKEMGGGIKIHSAGLGQGASVSVRFLAGNPLGLQHQPQIT